jgi:hypothetical protein
VCGNRARTRLGYRHHPKKSIPDKCHARTAAFSQTVALAWNTSTALDKHRVGGENDDGWLRSDHAGSCSPVGFVGAPDRNRTCGLPLRRRSLYPTELLGPGRVDRRPDQSPRAATAGARTQGSLVPPSARLAVRCTPAVAGSGETVLVGAHDDLPRSSGATPADGRVIESAARTRPSRSPRWCCAPISEESRPVKRVSGPSGLGLRQPTLRSGCDRISSSSAATISATCSLLTRSVTAQ